MPTLATPSQPQPPFHRPNFQARPTTRVLLTPLVRLHNPDPIHPANSRPVAMSKLADAPRHLPPLPFFLAAQPLMLGAKHLGGPPPPRGSHKAGAAPHRLHPRLLPTTAAAPLHLWIQKLRLTPQLPPQPCMWGSRPPLVGMTILWAS